MTWIDLSAELPWLFPPPFWVSHADGPRLRAELRRLGFSVFEVRTEAAVTEHEFREAVAQALDLYDYAALNWDTFVDAFGDHVRAETKPIALIWLDPVHVFKPDLAHGLRLYSALSSILDRWNRVGADGHQVVLVLEGESRLPGTATA